MPARPGAPDGPPRKLLPGHRLLAANGARVNAMTSTVTHDPRVAAAVSAHFEAKYAGLAHHLNGGRLIDLEAGVRPIYRHA